MNTDHIINAWRDDEYRESLTADEQALMPTHPAGSVALSDTDLAAVDGGTTNGFICGFSLGVITAYTPSVLNGGTCQVDTSGCC